MITARHSNTCNVCGTIGFDLLIMYDNQGGYNMRFKVILGAINGRHLLEDVVKKEWVRV